MMKKLSSLKSLKSFKSIKLPESLQSLKSLKIEFDKTKAVKAASSVVLFGFSGWFLWHTFLVVPEPTLPPSLPQAAAAINPVPVTKNPVSAAQPIETVENLTLTDPNELIDKLLVVTGWNKQVDDIPNQILQGIKQTSIEAQDPVVQMKTEQMVTEAFNPKLIKQYLHASLKNNFDLGRAERLLQSYHQPWLQKITQIEMQEIQPAALQTYASGLTDASLSEKRVQLFQQYDSAVQLTEFMVELSSGMIRAMLNGAVDNDEPTMAEFDTEITQIREDLHEDMRNQVFALLAYIYRELNDSELEAYVEFLTSDDGMWLNTTLMQAALEKLNIGSFQIGQQIAALCETTKPCIDDSSSEIEPVTDTLIADSTAKEAHQYALTARSNLDARECLNLTDSMAIHRCAENFR